MVGGMLMRLDRPAAAEFSFFLAIPTMVAAFVYQLVQVRAHLGAERAAEIAIGFVMAFIASAVVVKPFLSFVRRSGFAPFAWYRIAFGGGAADVGSRELAGHAVAATELRCRVLRDRPAGDQRGGAGVDLRYH